MNLHELSPAAGSNTKAYRKGRGETEFKLVGADGNLAAGTASKLEIDLTADDDGAQYYCHVGYNDVGLDTGTTLVNIEAEETAPTTVNATPIRTRRLFSQASAGAKKFLDHTLVNTAGPTDSEGSKDPAPQRSLQRAPWPVCCCPSHAV